MNKQRIQFYPSAELLDKLSKKSNELQIPIAQLVKDILDNTDFSTYKPAAQSFGNIYPIIKSEIESYISEKKLGDTFVIRDASKTYSEIPQTIFIKGKGMRTNSMRARVGRAFHDDVKSGKIPRIDFCIINGNKIVDKDEHALVYKICR